MDTSIRRCNTLKAKGKLRMDTSVRRCNTLKVCSNGTKLPEEMDFISALPDVILVSVLSLLTTKEAGRTCVLSKRWMDVWAYVPLLIFHSSPTEYGPSLAETIRYLHCVHQVVSSHKASTVDEFSLRYVLSDSCKESIDTWVRFAVEKRVKRFELNFASYWIGVSRYPYSFPSLSSWNSLTSFALASVNVTGEVLESLIHNCKALEFLSVIGSQVLVALKVVGPSLKSLRIKHCFKIEKMEIYAPNLVSLDYSVYNKLRIPLTSNPKLTELSIHGIMGISHLMWPITCQIEVLKLQVGDAKLDSTSFLKWTRLKTLDFIYRPKCEKDMFGVSSLIKAAPFLNKLVIQLDFSTISENGNKWEGEEHWCHQHLKTVQIVGYRVFASRFAKYLIEHVVALKKLNIDTQRPFHLRRVGEHAVDKEITRAIDEAEKLRKNLKPGTELEIY